MLVYNIIGIFSAVFVLIAMSGLVMQLKTIFERKKLIEIGILKETATEALSLSRFSTSFLAFFSIFLYGLTLEHFNHYLVWPRVIALILLLAILFFIRKDSRDLSSGCAFYGGLCIVIVATVIAFSEFKLTFYDSGIPHGLIFISTLLLAKGGFDQIVKIRSLGHTGALSLTMHQLFCLKDVSSLIFGFVMGIQSGWPIILFHLTSLSLQFITLWHFRLLPKSAKID
jgi:hypothetical protein